MGIDWQYLQEKAYEPSQWDEDDLVEVYEVYCSNKFQKLNNYSE